MTISYRLSLIIYITGLVVMTGATLTLLSLNAASRAAGQMAGSVFRQVTTTAAGQTRALVLTAAPLAKTIQALAGKGLDISDSEILAHQLIAIARNNPQFTWISYSDRQGNFTGTHWSPDGKLRVNQSTVGAGATGMMIEHIVGPDDAWTFSRKSDHWDYDPRTRPFYRLAAKNRHLTWVGPYVFWDEAVPGVTCAVPIFDSAGQLKGVLTVDFDLRTLSRFAADSQTLIGEHSKLVILTPQGTLLADPAVDLKQQRGLGGGGDLPNVSDVGDPLAAAMFAAIPDSIRNETNVAAEHRFHRMDLRFGGEFYFAAATTFEVDDGLTWIVAVAAPQADFLADAHRDALFAAGVSSIAVLAAMGVGVLMARRVSGPIVSLLAFMRRVGAGELEAQAKLGGSTEFRELSTALNGMIAQLRDRLRLRHSIAVAQQVQRKLLPAAPPSVPGLDIAGHSTYCDETGGDYYDFLSFDKDRTHLFAVIGDAMGHGIGAALPMAGARAVVRTRVPQQPSLGGLLAEVNRAMADDLRGESFMTMLVAVIDIDTRVVSWASAGHDPIIVYDPAADHFFELVGSDLPLGIDETAQFQDFKHPPLQPGCILMLGTDGVWETADEHRELFGKIRLQETIRAASGRSAAEISQAIRRDIESFRGSAPQTDDITFVVIRLLGDAVGQSPAPNPAAGQSRTAQEAAT